jgi:hypothetical protein
MKPGIQIGVLCLTLAVAGVALFFSQRTNAELTARITRLARQNADLCYDLKQAARQAADVGRRAVELDTQLGSAKTHATATVSQNVQLTRELTEREQREAALMAELAALQQQAPAARGEAARVRIDQLEAQLVQLLTRALEEPAVVEALPAPEPPPVRHQVVRVGPADAFVVLDYGAAHGARPQAVIRLQRGTSELAQVQISDVRPGFSLAQVLPGTLKGQLQTGDLVVFNP